jgi:hypothetical protein
MSGRKSRDMIAVAIPTEFADVYVALGWRLVHEGCCGQAHVMPPATRALARREVAR